MNSNLMQFKNLKTEHIKNQKELEMQKEIFKKELINYAKANNLNLNDALNKILMGLPVDDDIRSYVLGEYRKFDNLFEQIKYVNNKGWCDCEFENETINIKPDISIFRVNNKNKMYHGTSFESLLSIIKDGFIYSESKPGNITNNLVFLSDDINYSKWYGIISGVNTKINPNDTYVILELDVSEYELYHWKNNEYVVYDNIKTDSIQKVYICNGKNINTFTKDEVNEMCRLLRK